jgi:hypothetical protein
MALLASHMLPKLARAAEVDIVPTHKALAGEAAVANARC